MLSGKSDRPAEELPEHEVQREELTLFWAVLDLLHGATRSQDPVKREAAFRLSTKLKHHLCAAGLALRPPPPPSSS